MGYLAALPLALPLLGAAVVAGMGVFLSAHRRVLDLVAIVCTFGVVIVDAVLFHAVQRDGLAVYWFGGWRPVHSLVVGVDFAVDPFSAGIALLASTLMLAALIFSWHYFDSAGGLFHVLMLVFLGAMEGFSMTGDLFDMFVFFELMGVAAYALTAYRVEEEGPLQGALNFAITNSVGAFFALVGVALLYGRTGTLNFAQLGHALAGHRPDVLVTVAFVAILVAFMTKGAIAPFHFWLADAHAVAPTPVCVLFSGAMVELGLYGIARIYWTVFSGPLAAHDAVLQSMLLAFGAVTAVIGSAMSVTQRHIKRLLAYSTMAHAGEFLVGIGLLSPAGLSGTALFALGHGLVKGALFMGAGIVLHRLGTVNEANLQGRGRQLWVAGMVFGVGGLGLAGVPPFATSVGDMAIRQGLDRIGAGWLGVIFILTSALTGGAVLRITGRIFFGMGDPLETEADKDDAADEERSETEGPHSRTPIPMMAAPLALMAGGVAIGMVPGLWAGTFGDAVAFSDLGFQVAKVIDHGRSPLTHLLVPALAGATLPGLEAALGAVIVAAIGLYPRRLGVAKALDWLHRATLAPVERAQSGRVGDYVAWITLGAALLAGWMIAGVG